MSNAIVRIQPSKTGASGASVNIMERFRQNRIHFVGRNKKRAFEEVSGLSKSLNRLISRAYDLATSLNQDLSFELDERIRLNPEILEKMLAHSLNWARRLGSEMISVRLKLEGSKLRVYPHTWSGQALIEQELEGLRASARALSEMDKKLSQKGLTADEAEKKVAAVLFKHFKASVLKAYDVAEDGSIRVSHLFAPGSEGAKKVYRGAEIRSHFSDWVPPEKYLGEVMFEIVIEDEPLALVKDPQNDPRCRKESGEGAIQFESEPFALIGEKNASGRTTRVYKMDWKTKEELLAYSEMAFKEVFKRLQDFKQSLSLQSEMRFIDEIFNIAATEANIDDALEDISIKIAGFFESNGRGILADKVTIMLYDPVADLLATRVSWTKGGIKKMGFYSGRGDRGIARKVFDRGSDEPLYLRKLTDWREDCVLWQREGKGSLIATLLAVGNNKYGVIVVSSETQNAFTQDQVRVLGEVSRRTGPAFERIIKGLEAINLDSKFGLGYGQKVYNAPYLQARLNAEIQLIKKEDKPLSLIYLDVDFFKPLNEVWGNHDDVDRVLAAIFSRLQEEVREGEIYRVGGEEIVVRLNIPLQEAAVIAERLRAVVDKPITVKVPHESRQGAARKMATILNRAPDYPESGILKDAGTGKLKVNIEEGRRGEHLLVVSVRKTVSVGVAAYRQGDDGKRLIDRAERAQNDAKNGGRNRFVVAV